MKIILTLTLLLVPAFAHADDKIYNRVIGDGKIRCGYIHWEPGFSVDPNTKRLSGIFYDLTEEVGRRLSLKIDWVEETGWSSAIEGVSTGRFDAVCSNFWPTPARSRLADFSAPVSYSPLYVWVRPGSPLLKAKTSTNSLNKAESIFAYVDGSTASQIIERRFPLAQKVTYPEKTPLSDMVNGITLNKGDITIMDAVTVGKYLKTNPGKLIKLNPDQPVAVYPNTMLLPGGEARFKAMIDNTIRDILADGTFTNILEKNSAAELYLPVATPYGGQK